MLHKSTVWSQPVVGGIFIPFISLSPILSLSLFLSSLCFLSPLHSVLFPPSLLSPFASLALLPSLSPNEEGFVSFETHWPIIAFTWIMCANLQFSSHENMIRFYLFHFFTLFPLFLQCTLSFFFSLPHSLSQPSRWSDVKSDNHDRYDVTISGITHSLEWERERGWGRENQEMYRKNFNLIRLINSINFWFHVCNISRIPFPSTVSNYLLSFSFCVTRNTFHLVYFPNQHF